MAVFLSTADKKTFRGHSGDVPRNKKAPPRMVLHTTETKGFPGYNSGAAAPHFTIGVGHSGSLPNEKPGVVRVRQHISLDRTALALKHPSGTPETNHQGSHCVQIETITYVGDQPKHGIVGNKGNFPAPLTAALAGLVREILEVIPGINIDHHPEMWSATGSAGSGAKQRFTAKEWAEFDGICGHEHVPDNSHWDPGALDIESFVALVKSESAGSGATTSGVAPTVIMSDWPMVLELGDNSDKVEIVRGVLQTLGYGDFAPGGLYNAKVEKAVRALQKDENINVDGLWGPQTHSHAASRLETAVER